MCCTHRQWQWVPMVTAVWAGNDDIVDVILTDVKGANP
jgi:hypothetical protein